VPLAQYSDVVFLEYSKLCGQAKQQVSGLKYMLALNTENPTTWSIVLKALMNKNGGKSDIPLWPGTEFSMNMAEGKALLGTQIGAPLAWMMIQHKKAFGAKSGVKVWSSVSSPFECAANRWRGADLPSTRIGQSLPQQRDAEPRHRSAVLELAVLSRRCTDGEPLRADRFVLLSESLEIISRWQYPFWQVVGLYDRS
jgi:hypothetical protein